MIEDTSPDFLWYLHREDGVERGAAQDGVGRGCTGRCRLSAMVQMYEEEEEEGGESPHDGEAGREYTTRFSMVLLLMMAKEDEDCFLPSTSSPQTVTSSG